MRLRILGGGAFGAHLASALRREHNVTLHEIAPRLFSGASGNIPARLHCGSHYPRSKLTRAGCQEHFREFMDHYGDFTHSVPVNLYCIAEHDSLVDFGTYKQILRGEIEFITVERSKEFGLQNVEGAVLTGERHILVDRWRDYFAEELVDVVEYGRGPGNVDDDAWDLTIDTTFCAHDAIGIDRFEACLTLLLEGPAERAITIMDGPFPSLYAWNEAAGLSSLTSARWTALARKPTWIEARAVLDGMDAASLHDVARQMFDQMASYYPRLRDEYRIADYRMAVRAMPRSAADARLVDVVRVGERAIRIRAGKLDAIFHAERLVRAMLPEFVR